MFVTTSVLFAALAALAAAAENCFEFTGVVAEDGFRPKLGETVKLTWTVKDTSTCSSVTEKTRVKIELWDDDFGVKVGPFSVGGDQLIKTLSSDGEGDDSVANSGSFEWTVPYNLDEIVSASTSLFEGEPELYFRVSVQSNKDVNTETRRFGLEKSDVYITVAPLETRNYATGSSIRIEVRSNALPNREIQCFFARGALLAASITPYMTDSSTDEQLKVLSLKMPSNVESGEYRIFCRTTTGNPPASVVTPRDESFQVEQIDHDLEITSPTADTTIKANTDLTVRWTSKKGLAANEKVIVSLRRRYIFSNSFLERFVKTEAVSDPVSHEAGSVTIRVPPGTTGDHYVVLYVANNGEIRVESETFVVTEADKACTMQSPSALTPLLAGNQVMLKYTCAGYVDGETAKAQLVSINNHAPGAGREDQTLLVAESAPVSTGEHTLTYNLPDTMHPGWSWYLYLSTSDGDPALEQQLTIVNEAVEQCTAGGSDGSKQMTCRAAGSNKWIAVSDGHDVEVTEIKFSFRGVRCGSKFAEFTVDTKARVNGQELPGGASTLVQLYPGQPTTGTPLLGSTSQVPSFEILTKEVQYPLDRSSVSFKFALSESPLSGEIDVGEISLTLGGLPTDIEGCVAVDASDPSNDKTFASRPMNTATLAGDSSQVTAAVGDGGSTPAPGVDAPSMPDSANSLALGAAAVVAALALF